MSIHILISIVSVIMLLLAIPPIWPYGYYTFLRVVICASSAYMAYLGFDRGKEGWGWIFGIIAVLFNPLVPIYLTKEIWVVIDVIVAGVFLVSIFTLKSREE